MNQVLPSKTHRVDSKQDYGPKVRTNLTLKGSSYRIVNLIFYVGGASHFWRVSPSGSNTSGPPCPALNFASRLVGLVVKASAPRTEDPGFESRLRRELSRVESY